MVAIHQTAYPRLKKDLKPEELGDVYTPTLADKRFAQRHTQRASAGYLGILIQLKIVQRLGRFAPLSEIPHVILQHIKEACRSRASIENLRNYFSSGAKDRHIKLIRQHLNIQSFDASTTTPLVHGWAMDAAKTKEALADVINVTLEYLVKEQYEIPSYHTLFKICRAARAEINTTY